MRRLRDVAADLFEAFKAVPLPAPEGAFRDAIERTSEAPLIAYTLPRTRAGAAGYREVECPVEKPLVCEALGEDCKIFGLSGRVP